MKYPALQVIEREGAMTSQYHAIYESWKNDPEGFWAGAAGEIDWFTPFEKPFDAADGAYGRWFPGATCNTCYNCVDRHVERGRAGQPAIIYDSPITGTRRTISYEELLDEVQALAYVLQDKGIKKGDRVIIYMPMVPEAAIAMLACARIGAIHSVVFGGFAASELATRINDCHTKADHFRFLRHRARTRGCLQAFARRSHCNVENQARDLHHSSTRTKDLRPHRRP